MGWIEGDSNWHSSHLEQLDEREGVGGGGVEVECDLEAKKEWNKKKEKKKKKKGLRRGDDVYPDPRVKDELPQLDF
ncbi:unnamed protein product [Hydatigera taeniaeformis]|uniref:Uncharacterized protein n=1 Tax=Hydatigena taeniaeformis TaxID=6205 RepID=A0A0R3WQT4_HYDTA|nr:unnamed protein product [Hydatigera taeniaeformis]